MRRLQAIPVVLFLLTALLAGGSARSQDTPSDLRVDESKQKGTLMPSLREFGSFGPALGMMKLFGGTLGSKAQVKPVMQGVFRYRFSDDWVGLGEFGFGWNSFRSEGDTVLAFTYGTLGVARRFASALDSDFRALGGVGMYHYQYKFHGKELRDPGEKQQLYFGYVRGLFLGVEGERRMARHVTVTATLEDHFVFTSSNRYVQLFNRNYSFATLRLGANYHFSPTEGIKWERRTRRVITMESGKETK